MPFLPHISCFLFLIKINALVSLKMDIETISFDDYIVLTCTVHGIQTINTTTTRQWSMGDDDKLLCYNGRINNLRKYKEKVLPGNEFSLTVFNITKSDLNVVYQCRYGFDAASKLIEADKPKLFLSLRLVDDFIIFGGDIILTCMVNGISTVDRDITRQWSMGNDDQLLSYNGRINNRRKYEETFLPGNEFRLKVFNITEKDVNITYRCRYGFDTATYFIKINESEGLQKSDKSYHSFNSSSHGIAGQKEVNHGNDTISSENDKENLGTKHSVTLLSTLISLAVILLLILVTVALFIAKRKHIRKETKNKNQINNIMERENLCKTSEDIPVKCLPYQSEHGVETDKTFAFTCVVDHDDVTVDWFHKGSPVTNSNKHEIRNEKKKHTILIKSFGSPDISEYTFVICEYICSDKPNVDESSSPGHLCKKQGYEDRQKLLTTEGDTYPVSNADTIDKHKTCLHSEKTICEKVSLPMERSNTTVIDKTNKAPSIV